MMKKMWYGGIWPAQCRYILYDAFPPSAIREAEGKSSSCKHLGVTIFIIHGLKQFHSAKVTFMCLKVSMRRILLMHTRGGPTKRTNGRQMMPLFWKALGHKRAPMAPARPACEIREPEPTDSTRSPIPAAPQTIHRCTQ